MLPHPIQQVILNYLDINKETISFETRYDINLFSWLIDVMSVTGECVVGREWIQSLYIYNHAISIWLFSRFNLSKNEQIIALMSFKFIRFGSVYGVRFNILNHHNIKKNNAEKLSTIIKKLMKLGYAICSNNTYKRHKPLLKPLDSDIKKLCGNYMLKDKKNKKLLNTSSIHQNKRITFISKHLSSKFLQLPN
jgi:hypothetical protein